MKLKKLNVKKLYGHYDYTDIKFNDDVTFLYGVNGCGKTTILNIIEAIITGKIYNLNKFNFEKIDLEYVNNSNDEAEGKDTEKYVISIIQQEKELKVIFEKKEYFIPNEYLHNRLNSGLSRKDRIEEQRMYFSEYDFLESIARTFNYVYLPLNRSIKNYDHEDLFYSRNLNMMSNKQRHSAKYNGMYIEKDSAMVQVESLVYSSNSLINSTISRINDNFRNQILKSLVDVGNNFNSEELVKQMIKNEEYSLEIDNTKKAYLKILKDLKITNKNEEKKIEKFFDEVTDDVRKDSQISVETLYKFMEISRVNRIVKLAEDNEKRKKKVKYPVELFLNTVNEFTNKGKDKKLIVLDEEGSIGFKTKYSNEIISIHNLSSGEKQLITFFANLIFKVKNDSEGIFVVDEPELSLHLTWQKEFVEKIIEINNGIQLIFATHAPEIIGKNRKKTFKLEKTYVDVEKVVK